MFRKILAIIIAVLIFALIFLAVKFTKVEVPNFNRNLIMLAVVDISAFGLVIWKLSPPCENKEDNCDQDEQLTEKLKEDKQKEESINKDQKETEQDEKETEQDEKDEKEKSDTKE